ncbi:MAG: sensor histidine kinase, partial [Solirubrobacteraceae bacterium]
MTSTPRWHDTLLPGELRDDPRGRRSARDWLVDVLMYLIAVGVGVVVLLETWDQHGDWAVVLDIGLGLTSLVLLWWRRARPDAVGAATAAASIVSGLAAGPALIGAFNVALRGSRRGILVVVGVSAAAVVLVPLIYPPSDGYLLNVFVGVLLMAVVFGWGLLVRVRREQLLALRERAVRLEAEQRLRIEQAREAERRRIAREMHDVLAHRVSLLSLHAGALEFRPDAAPEEIAEAAGVIRASAHAALEELRAVIGVLRDGADEGAPEPPQPTLGQIPALVDESRTAGMRVTCRIEVDDVDGAPAALGRTAYRVVQEGLTNARKHADGSPVTLTVTGEPGDGLR